MTSGFDIMDGKGLSIIVSHNDLEKKTKVMLY